MLDPAAARSVRSEDLHETDYSPWEGQEVAAWPVLTILRGKVVVEGGEFHGDPGAGQYLLRAVPASIRNPAA